MFWRSFITTRGLSQTRDRRDATTTEVARGGSAAGAVAEFDPLWHALRVTVARTMMCADTT